MTTAVREPSDSGLVSVGLTGVAVAIAVGVAGIADGVRVGVTGVAVDVDISVTGVTVGVRVGGTAVAVGIWVGAVVISTDPSSPTTGSILASPSILRKATESQPSRFSSGA
jgi:hypothetical protein